MYPQTSKQIIDMMQICKDICSMGHALRKQNKIPVRTPLKELQFDGAFLWKEYQKIIKEELNLENINPFFTKKDEEYEQWVIKSENGINVRLNVYLDKYQVEQGEKSKERRQQILFNKFNEKNMEEKSLE